MAAHVGGDAVVRSARRATLPAGADLGRRRHDRVRALEQVAHAVAAGHVPERAVLELAGRGRRARPCRSPRSGSAPPSASTRRAAISRPSGLSASIIGWMSCDVAAGVRVARAPRRTLPRRSGSPARGPLSCQTSSTVTTSLRTLDLGHGAGGGRDQHAMHAAPTARHRSAADRASGPAATAARRRCGRRRSRLAPARAARQRRVDVGAASSGGTARVTRRSPRSLSSRSALAGAADDARRRRRRSRSQRSSPRHPPPRHRPRAQ